MNHNSPFVLGVAGGVLGDRGQARTGVQGGDDVGDFVGDGSLDGGEHVGGTHGRNHVLELQLAVDGSRGHEVLTGQYFRTLAVANDRRTVDRSDVLDVLVSLLEGVLGALVVDHNRHLGQGEVQRGLVDVVFSDRVFHRHWGTALNAQVFLGVEHLDAVAEVTTVGVADVLSGLSGVDGAQGEGFDQRLDGAVGITDLGDHVGDDVTHTSDGYSARLEAELVGLTLEVAGQLNFQQWLVTSGLERGEDGFANGVAVFVGDCEAWVLSHAQHQLTVVSGLSVAGWTEGVVRHRRGVDEELHVGSADLGFHAELLHRDRVGLEFVGGGPHALARNFGQGEQVRNVDRDGEHLGLMRRTAVGIALHVLDVARSGDGISDEEGTIFAVDVFRVNRPYRQYFVFEHFTGTQQAEDRAQFRSRLPGGVAVGVGTQAGSTHDQFSAFVLVLHADGREQGFSSLGLEVRLGVEGQVGSFDVLLTALEVLHREAFSTVHLGQLFAGVLVDANQVSRDGGRFTRQDALGDVELAAAEVFQHAVGAGEEQAFVTLEGGEVVAEVEVAFVASDGGQATVDQRLAYCCKDVLTPVEGGGQLLGHVIRSCSKW
ncbi:hypothetical protein D3C81_350440 [compost metagenome]